MNYSKIYDDLVKKRKRDLLLKDKSIYTELHHIIPKSFGGNNSDNNLVRFTAKEHFIAHLLLYKIHKNDKFKEQALYAIYCMCGLNKMRKNKITSRVYDRLKNECKNMSLFIKCGRIGGKHTQQLCITNPEKYARMMSKIRYNLEHRMDSWSQDKYEQYCSKLSESISDYYKTHKSVWCGKKHSIETKKKQHDARMNIDVSGINNPMNNMVWIYNSETNENIIWDSNRLIPFGWIKYKCNKKQDYYKKFVIPEILNEIKERRMSRYINITYMMYNWYKKHGFKSTCKQFNYTKSRISLFKRFKHYIKKKNHQKM